MAKKVMGQDGKMYKVSKPFTKSMVLGISSNFNYNYWFCFKWWIR